MAKDNNVKEDNKKKSNVGAGAVAFQLLLGVTAGIFIVFALESVEDSTGLSKGYVLLVEFAALIACFFVSVIIHEGGHLVMGLATGYRFVSFRVGSLTVVRQNDRIKLKRYIIPGTLGQCIMTHDPVSKPEDIKYFWYHFGGCFFNFITLILSVGTMLISHNTVVDIISMNLAFVSAELGVSNCVPMDMGVPNDGLNIRLQYKDPDMRMAILNNLIFNGMMYEGCPMSDIPESLFDCADPSGNVHSCGLALQKVQYLMYTHKFAEAEKILGQMAANDRIIGLYLNEAKCELIFCRIVLGCEAEKINELYDKSLKTYIKQTEKYFVTRRRLMYAYYLLMEKNEDKAKWERMEAEKLKNSYPCMVEYECEMELIDYAASVK